MAFVPVFQIESAAYAPNGIDAIVTLWIETSRGNVLVLRNRLIVSPSSPTRITKAQAFAACKTLATTLQANEDTAAGAVVPPSLQDSTIYDATQAGAVAAAPANIAPLTGQPPVGGATV